MIPKVLQVYTSCDLFSYENNLRAFCIFTCRFQNTHKHKHEIIACGEKKDEAQRLLSVHFHQAPKQERLPTDNTTT